MSESLVDELGVRLVSLEPGDLVEPIAVPRPTATASFGTPSMIAIETGRRVIDGPVVVGRTGDVDIAIDSPLVSRRHAELWTDAGALLCRDLGSTNGTLRVRDDSVTIVGTGAATLLVDGDVLTTADGVELLRVLEP